MGQHSGIGVLDKAVAVLTAAAANPLTLAELCAVTGLPRRTYSPSKEKEAFGVAGAALVPFAGLVSLLRAGATPATVSARYGVSVELATMRINVTGARKVAA